MMDRGFLAGMAKMLPAAGLAGLLLAPAAVAGAAPAAGAARTAGADLDWPQYLHDSSHSSVSMATAFTPSNAASATEVWHWQPPVVTGKPAPVLDASPTVAAGTVYIGSQSGGFYALNESTGAETWSRQLDTRPKATCRALGITATAAVLPDPVTGTPTVYVSGARYLYALDAATGAEVWQTEIGPPDASAPDAYYNWSSPAAAGGHIYVGLASGCDNPLIRGGVVELDQHTGQVLHTWYTVPANSIGGSIWSTVAVAPNGHGVWVSTGNECDPALNTCPLGNRIGHSLSIVHLSSSLTLLQAWLAPGTTGHDWDFGSSPTLFGGIGAALDVGACNKNGLYYALAARPLGSSPLWQDTIGVPSDWTGCLPSAVWDGRASALYIGGNATTIEGVSYGGSIRRVHPVTGGFVWQTGLPCGVRGTPTLDGAGVLAVGTYTCAKPNTPGAYLLDASTGAILATLPVGSTHVFGQPVFAQDTLFVATEANGLYDFAP